MKDETSYSEAQQQISFAADAELASEAQWHLSDATGASFALSSAQGHERHMNYAEVDLDPKRGSA